jgi:hypothetical protein
LRQQVGNPFLLVQGIGPQGQVFAREALVGIGPQGQVFAREALVGNGRVASALRLGAQQFDRLQLARNASAKPVGVGLLPPGD